MISPPKQAGLAPRIVCALAIPLLLMGMTGWHRAKDKYNIKCSTLKICDWGFAYERYNQPMCGMNSITVTEGKAGFLEFYSFQHIKAPWPKHQETPLKPQWR